MRPQICFFEAQNTSDVFALMQRCTKKKTSGPQNGNREIRRAGAASVPSRARVQFLSDFLTLSHACAHTGPADGKRREGGGGGGGGGHHH